MWTFETADHIDDYLAAIDGCNDFIVVRKPGYVVLNYLVVKSDTFPDPNEPDISLQDRRNRILRRDCRGIIFCETTGKVLRKCFHKFFNLGERTETLPDNMNFKGRHVIMDKLDGSMIAPFMLDGQVRWGTKMGLTDVAAPVEEFVKRNPHYEKFAAATIASGFTPIFEWCSPQQKIVLPQAEDRLILTAIRDTKHGYYVRSNLTAKFQIPQCTVYDGESVEDVHAFMDRVRNEVDIEGYVVRFDTGHMVKVKCEWYCNIHKIKEQINSERAILDLMYSGGLDDALALLDPTEAARIETFVETFDMMNQKLVRFIQVKYDFFRKNYSRKDFALGPAKTIPDIHRIVIFKLWDDFEKSDDEKFFLIYQEVDAYIKKHLTNATAYDNMKIEMYPDLVY